ncbi:MAG: hypothetical protein HY427_01280 [Candidatus Levybacteria bacterium]|nr:hypothetical protein [Candidatus Levybacteria bacterium]
MSLEKNPAIYRDQAHRAQGAAITLESYYGGPHSQIAVGEVVEPQLMTDQEAEQKLLVLAGKIRSGEVKSHIDVARVIRSLGNKMSPTGGGASLGINDAALKVEEAIIRHESRLTDSPRPLRT